MGGRWLNPVQKPHTESVAKAIMQLNDDAPFLGVLIGAVIVIAVVVLIAFVL